MVKEMVRAAKNANWLIILAIIADVALIVNIIHHW